MHRFKRIKLQKAKFINFIKIINNELDDRITMYNIYIYPHFSYVIGYTCDSILLHFPVLFPENWRVRGVIADVLPPGKGRLQDVAFPTLSNFARRLFSRRTSTRNRVSLRVAQPPGSMKDICTFVLKSAIQLETTPVNLFIPDV